LIAPYFILAKKCKKVLIQIVSSCECIEGMPKRHLSPP
jgi:hypothetical protein